MFKSMLQYRQEFCRHLDATSTLHKSPFREWAALRISRSSTRQTMLTVGSSKVNGYSARQTLCTSTLRSWREEDSDQRSTCLLTWRLPRPHPVTSTRLPRFKTMSRRERTAQRFPELFETIGRLDTLAQVHFDAPTKLRQVTPPNLHSSRSNRCPSNDQNFADNWTPQQSCSPRNFQDETRPRHPQTQST